MNKLSLLFSALFLLTPSAPSWADEMWPFTGEYIVAVGECKEAPGIGGNYQFDYSSCKVLTELGSYFFDDKPTMVNDVETVPSTKGYGGLQYCESRRADFLYRQTTERAQGLELCNGIKKPTPKPQGNPGSSYGDEGSLTEPPYIEHTPF